MARIQAGLPDGPETSSSTRLVTVDPRYRSALDAAIAGASIGKFLS